MLTTLATAYTDTRAGDLAWCLGKAALPALALLDLSLGDIDVQLRLLGASHQVLLTSGQGDCSETVACLPGRSAPLPMGVAKRMGGWEYEFAACVEELPGSVFTSRAQELLDLVADHPNGLAGIFPGDPDAFTAMLVSAREGTVHWRTWHAYPQEGRLVATRSRVVPGAVTAPVVRVPAAAWEAPASAARSAPAAGRSPAAWARARTSLYPSGELSRISRTPRDSRPAIAGRAPGGMAAGGETGKPAGYSAGTRTRGVPGVFGGSGA